LGIEVSKNNLDQLGVSSPPPCSDEAVCLLVRRATLNLKVRAKKITIDKLWEQPVLLADLETDRRAQS